MDTSLRLVAPILFVWLTTVVPAASQTLRESRVQGGGSSSATTIVAPAAAHETGNLIVVMTVHQANVITAVNDTIGNTYTAIGSQFSAGSNRYNIFFTISTGTNANNIVTATIGASSSYRAIVVHEYTNPVTPNTADGSGATGSGTGTTILSGTVTITHTYTVLVAIMSASGTNITDGGEGWTALTPFAVTGDANAYYADGYKIGVSSSETVTASSNTGDWGIKVAAFKVTPSGAAIPCMMGGGILTAGCGDED